MARLAAAPPTGATPRIGSGMLASLLFGRGLFRVSQYGAAIALLVIWGEQLYGYYAAALGAFLWLTAVTSVGTEKAALKLIARARHTRADLLGAFTLVACAVPVLPVAVFVLAVATRVERAGGAVRRRGSTRGNPGCQRAARRLASGERATDL